MLRNDNKYMKFRVIAVQTLALGKGGTQVGSYVMAVHRRALEDTLRDFF